MYIYIYIYITCGPSCVQIDEKVKKERLRIINVLASEHAHERRQRYLGRIEEVLVEKRNEKFPNQVPN